MAWAHSCFGEQGPRMTQGSQGCASLVWQSLPLGCCCPGFVHGEPRVSVQEQRDPAPSPCARPAAFPVSRAQLAVLCGNRALSFHLKAATMWQRTTSTLCVHRLGVGPKATPSPAGLRLHSQNSSCSEEKQVYTEGGGSGAL